MAISIIEDLPYKAVVATEDQTKKATMWCCKHIGPVWSIDRNPQGDWAYGLNVDIFSRPGHGAFYFRNEKDYVFFTLKWT